MQRLGAFAEIGDGETFGDAHHGLPHFLHDTADGAAGFVGTGALFVETFAHTTHGSQCSLNVADDDGEADILGAARETIPTGNAAPALDHASRLEVVEDLKSYAEVPCEMGNGATRLLPLPVSNTRTIAVPGLPAFVTTKLFP